MQSDQMIFDTKQGVQAALASSPFSSWLGLTCEHISKDEGLIEIRMPWRKELLRDPFSKVLHGGAIASLIDVTGVFAIAVLSNSLPPTISMNIDFLKPASGSDVKAVAFVRKQGQHISTVDVEVTGENETMLALGRASFSTSV